MEKRGFGKTGLCVTPLGFGAGEIGLLRVAEAECDRLLNGVLDAGVNVIDTAACYVDSEEKIGKFISQRRGEYVLITKCGHHVEDGDPETWTGPVVRGSIERSLRRLRTDRVDVLLLHSCGEEHLRDAELLEALRLCREKGLTRFIGYSGDDDPLLTAIGLAGLDCIETSVSICDQQAIERGLPRARGLQLGVVAKRPIANSCWRDMSQYGGGYGQYVEPYAERLRKMGFTPESVGFDGDWPEMALRFAAYQEGVHVALVGGKDLGHVRQNAELVGKGPLPGAVVSAIRSAWKACDDGSWKGQV